MKISDLLNDLTKGLKKAIQESEKRDRDLSYQITNHDDSILSRVKDLAFNSIKMTANGNTYKVIVDGQGKVQAILVDDDTPVLGSAKVDTLYTDKAIYKPKDSLKLTFNASDTGLAMIRVFDMASKVFETTLAIHKGENTFNWQLPDGDYKGYLIEVASGNSQYIAVNVNNHVEYAPIMGFLGNFGPDINQDQMNSIVKQLNRFHVNYVQFYDWYDRDDTPLRIVDGKPEQNWIDFMKRPTSFNTVKNYIDVVHNYGMQAMFYNLIYGSQLGIPSSDDSNLNWTNPDLTKEMFLYKDKDLKEVAGENDQGFGGKLNITYMNVLNPAWRNYLTGQANIVYQNLPFDGWHVDQLGTLPNETYSSDGVHLNWWEWGDGYGGMLKTAKAKNPDKRLTINNADNIGTEKVMASNTVDFMYVEPWGGIGFSFK